MELVSYFQSYKDYFWEWTTDEDVPDDTGYNENNLISIPNVGAIAYRPYIIEVLKQLQPQGFPPFGSLLLLLYATQEGYLNLDGILYHLKRVQLNYIDVEKLNIHEGIKFLENLRTLANKYKKGQNKIILLQTVFAHSPVVASSVNSNLLLRMYAKKSHIIAESANKKELQDSVIIKDIRTLAILGSKFPTTESIIKAMQGITEIPELEDEVVQEETTVETDKDFIQELIEDPKTFQIGSLIKRIWSGLKIPMRHLSPGEQPIGGISDMTNKGDFHRMLLSEFANEDEVFMNRVANNEALYIQREIPPEENIFERIILIDTSLKNWGTPKILAFASAIAVIKHPKAHSECKVFALGQTNVPISLDKLDEVIENLNQVSPVLEVSHALEKFFTEEHRGKDLEVFFITNQENLAHQKLQKVIHQNRDRLKFLVTTSSDGELNFYKHHKGTRKHIHKIMLPLKELWANPPKHKTINVQGNQIKTNIPKNYPLLFPTPKERIKTFLYEGDFYILSNKKQLLKTYLSDNYYNKNIYQNISTQKGCEVIIENISVKPKGQFALAKNKAGNYILAQFQQDKKILSKLNLNTKEYSELNLTGQNIPINFHLIYFNKNFYLYNFDAPKIFMISLEGHLSIEEVENDQQILKNGIKSETELNKLKDRGAKILNNFTKIGINDAEEFIISNFALEFHTENVYYLGKNLQKIEVLASQNKNKFAFEDGSEVITDHRGMLAFKSSNKNIPTFYMPSVHYGFMALATEKEFGGSEYYLPKDSKLKVREMDEMYSDYMEAFIKHILEHGT
ncbi:hypothetical protein PGH12_16065 [Chryseobacterium wangxinyae]|uniref:hypothetical protein n=1 Tax=Chryseobacterium sp. CY350 TaxID=2997336 RepID=UPI00226F7E1D|nr:hypothetical protein [Chryseobacterium sp. CY350]MCY0977881.1 hypothetical protein [Chryseobacterium sp. CY350]WBZ94970.1 hypothetical protein PGH12_16065 [Chryseobacterium sp. CY350]